MVALTRLLYGHEPPDTSSRELSPSASLDVDEILFSATSLMSPGSASFELAPCVLVISISSFINTKRYTRRRKLCAKLFSRIFRALRKTVSSLHLLSTHANTRDEIRPMTT